MLLQLTELDGIGGAHLLASNKLFENVKVRPKNHKKESFSFFLADTFKNWKNGRKAKGIVGLTNTYVQNIRGGVPSIRSQNDSIGRFI